MDRQPISKFRTLMVNPQWPSDADIAAGKYPPNTLLFRDLSTGEIVAQMDADDLFDPNGNRFWLDA